MSNPRSQNTEEDDPDLLALRAEALSTLILKQKKEVEIIQQRQPAYPPYPSHERHHLNHPPRLNGSPHFGGMRPEYSRNHFPPMDAHPRMMQPMGPATFGPQGQPFLPGRPPMMPLIQPHVNPNFVPQATPLPGIPIHRDFSIPMEEDMPILPLQEPGTFEPTPPSRLSPRSAMFVAKNEEALRRQKTRRRSSSSDRSRSRSPYKYRPRSRSPHQKLQHIARKRTRSKSPVKDIRRSRSPRRRSQGKRVSPKYSDRRRFNGNRDRRRDMNERKPLRVSPKTVEEKRENENKEEVKKSKSPSPAAVTETKKEENRAKTEQEIEDELLASSEDESAKEVKLDDEDELKLTADDNELDFLDDDEEESENEGRFKGKESTAPVKRHLQANSNFKSAYDRRDKPYSRHDYKRDSRRDRRNSRSRSPAKIRRKSPEPRKSPEISRKPAKEPTQSKVIVINKKNDEAKKAKAEKPLFKSTFNMVEPPTHEKKKDEAPKKEDAKERPRLVRPSAINRVEPLKIERAEKAKEAKAEKSIMKRLGGYIKDPGSTKAVKPAWAKDQA